MKKLLPLALLFLVGCSPIRIHQVSGGLGAGLKEPFNLEVSTDPGYLEKQLSEAVRMKFSTIASILPSEEGGTIIADFRSNPSLSTDSDGRTPFMTNPGSSPRKRHIFQSSEIEMTILDKNKEVLWKVKYRYEGRNDFKASYIQKPEEALEECVNRIFEILEKDLAGPGTGVKK